ncbi:hypothetical protein DPMN_079738 [Dreissena polymorpha]|uniref:Uncharacterized protein n=1 Tax=Dreissena polymorpha TaxID=45954 RepID=A0A9D3YSP5_DREPO|nr:hypothetical protein DPMN_079738 [Dreissena polymorpha]
MTFSHSEKDSILSVYEKETESRSLSEVQISEHEQVLSAYESVLSTPVKKKYENRLQEGYNVKGISPGYDTYVILKSKVTSQSIPDETVQAGTSSSVYKDQGECSALDLLANVATCLIQESDPVCETPSSNVSPVLKEALVLPKATTIKKKRKSTLDELPDHLTSPECIRKLENKNLDNIRKFARKEKKAKQDYLKNNENSSVSSAVKKTSVNTAVKGKSSINTSKGKAAAKSVKRNRKQIAEPGL